MPQESTSLTSDVLTDFDQKKKELECLKLELEQSKIRQEIDDMRQSWWQKFNSYPPLLTAAIALFSAYILARNGFYDFRENSLKFAEQELNRRVQKLATDTLAYTRQIDTLKIEKQALIDEQRALRKDLDISRNITKQAVQQAYDSISRLPFTPRSSLKMILDLQLENRKKSDSIFVLTKQMEHTVQELNMFMMMYSRQGRILDSLLGRQRL